MTDSYPNFKFTNIPPPLPSLQTKNSASLFLRTEAQTVFHAPGRIPDVEYDASVALKKQKFSQELQGTEAASSSATAGQTLHNGDSQRQQASATTPQASTSKPAPTAEQELAAAPDEPGSRTIVLQLGSASTRIGLASESAPRVLPFVIARPDKKAASYPPAHADLEDPALDPKIDTMRVELRSRMRSYKLRGTTGGQQIAREFNESVQPELVPEAQDSEHNHWTDTKTSPSRFIVGEQALRIPEPAAEGYVLRWPFYKGMFNTSAPYYERPMEILADVEDILTTWLQSIFGISQSNFSAYNVVFLAPDLSDYTFLRSMSDIIMRSMGFRAILVQNESVSAALGAGLSGACIVDMGASSIKISCIEDGWLMPDTRMLLNYGGDDMTMFMFEEFRRAAFPYRSATLSNLHDWYLIDRLKEMVSALGEADVSMSTHYFDVRRQGQPTKKYSVKFYDEPLLGSMLLFAPRVVDFERKWAQPRELWPGKDDVDEGMEWTNEPTYAMKNSVVIHPGASAGQSTNTGASPAPESKATNGAEASPAPGQGSGADGIDYGWEAGKLPLDLAIVQSLSAAGSEDRVKKLCGAIVLTGGLANLHNVAWGISSRLSAHLSQRYPILSQSAINVVPAPLDLDPSHLAWKGASVLSRIEVSSDLWVRADEYERLDFRAVRERALLPI